ncbi:MAG: AsmA-like C-terminal region-containing protein, partial [Deltaproteobacteria bacterium]|nr:AsmA-like C-terminal region-containing protein [Deltaproteobacteria bacterium]
FIIHTEPFQRYLLEQLSQATGYELRAEKITLSFAGGIGIRARNFRVYTSEGHEKAGAARIRMDFSLRDLLRGRMFPEKLAIIEPNIHLAARKDRGLSVQGKGPVLEKSYVRLLAAFPLVSLENATVTMEPAGFTLKDLNVQLTRKSKEPVVLRGTSVGTAFYQGTTAPFSASGLLMEDPENGLSIDGRCNIKEMLLTRLLLPEALTVKNGTVGINAEVKGSLDGILSIDGKLIFRGLNFLLINDGDKKAFSFDQLAVPFKASYADALLKIPFFQVQNKAFTLNGVSTLNFTKPHDPHLDLKVKSPFMTLATFRRIFPSSLLPIWLENRIFPIFSGGDVRVNLFSLNGPWQRLENLDLQENAELLKMNLTCKGLKAFKNEQALVVDRVSGDLEIRKGEIHVSGVRGRFGESHINSGSLFLKDLYVDDPQIRVTASGSFRVEDLLAQTHLKLMPPDVGSGFRQLAGATGKLDADLTVVYEPGWHFPKIEKGMITFMDCALDDPDIPFPIQIKEGALTINAENGKNFVAEGEWGKTRLSISGNLGDNWQTGKAHLVAMADMDELLGYFYPDLHASTAFKNKIPCQISLSKNNVWNFHGAFDLKQAYLETESVTVNPFASEGSVLFSGSILPKKKFTLRNLQCNLGKSSFTLSGAYDLAAKDAFNFNVSSKKLRLEDLGIRYKKVDFTAGGELNGKISVTASRKNPSQTKVMGYMEGKTLSFAAEAFPHPIKNCHFQLKFAGNDVLIDALALKLGKSPFQLTGEFQGWEGMRGDITLHSELLDLNDLIPPEMAEKFKKGDFESVSFTKGRSDQMKPGWKKRAHHFVETSDVHFSITAPKVKWEEASFGPLEVECALRSKDLYLSQSSVRFKRGRLLLRGHVKRGKNPEMLFTSYLEMEKQPLEDLPSPLAFVKDRIEGSLTMESLLYAKGNTKKELLSSLTGSTNILLEKGVIRRSNIFIKVLDFMSLTGAFETRPADLPKDGLYFSRIGGHLDIDKGIAKVDNLAMESPVFNAVAEGEVNLATGFMDAEIAIQPLTTADLLVSKIPIIGYLLRGDDDTLTAEYFKVDGKMSDPNVHYMAFKSMSNGTYSFFKRLLLSPQRLFQSISEAAGDFESKGLPLPDKSLQPEFDMAN